MAQVKPANTTFAKIKVIGVGGGGSNAVDSMIASQEVSGVEFVAINTDAQALLRSTAQTKLQIGASFTKGLGSGGDPEIGEAAAHESEEKIRDLLYDTEMVFITAGMGGGTGTGATPLIAELAREQDALTVAVVTKPFTFEGRRRMARADEGIANLTGRVDAHIVVPNQKLIEILDKKITLLNAFKYADKVLGQGVRGISDLITIPGMINADFADVRNIMTDSGSLLMGLGEASGENKAVVAARQAISSPLIELSIDGAKGLIFNITAGSAVLLREIEEAAAIISGTVDPDAEIIYGHIVDDQLADTIRITVIATGFQRIRPMPSYEQIRIKSAEKGGGKYEIPAFLRM